MKRRIVSIVFALCLCLALLPSTALAAEPATETADFTASDGGAAAIALLNAAKWDNAENSTWDSATKTLTLKGVNFQTTAGTAVKLPAGSIIVLADRTHNNIYGGDAEANETGGYQVKISVYGIYAEGALTIQGAGGLNVRSGKHTNTGNAWTYSTALYAKGLVTVEGGKVELTGGETKNGDCAFSTGLELPEGSGLSVTGGEVTAKGGESTNTEDGKANSSFSRGIDAYGASVSISGSGKLTGDAADKHGGLSWGVYISGGDLTVSDSANVFAHVHTGIEVSSGNLIQTGGRIDAGTVAGGYYGLLVERNPYDVGKTVGNATVSGGTLDVSLGEIYFSVYGAAENQGNFTVSGEGTTVYAKSIDGVRTLAITDATMRSGSISAEKLTLQSGSLTVTESVREYNSKLYANPALSLQDLTINGGTLNVSWYWGENTPIVFPVDDETGFPTPLVKIWGDGREATFNGGVSTFDTGCAGNIALKLTQFNLGDGMEITGADTDRCQLRSDTPVKIAAATTPSAVENVTLDYENISYKAGDTPRAAASVSGGNCTVAYECWTEIRQPEGGGQWYQTGRRWYSDSDKMAALPADERIIKFEAGNSYQYNVVLAAGSGYSFSNDETVVSVGEDEWGTPRSHKKLEIKESGKELHIKKIYTFDLPNAGQPNAITSAAVENVKLDYKPGDAPRATATVAAADQGKYRIANEYWQELDENDVPVAAWYSDGGAYSTLPTVTTFESGKKYVYSVMLLPERGYDFSREVAATVNGNSVTAVPATDGYLSLPNVKTITPTAESHTHSYGTAWKYDGTNHWHECACGDKADTAVHTFKWVTDKEATATEKGSKHEECTVCGYKKAAVEIPATGSGNGSADQPTNPGNTSSPQTGDNNSLALWFAVLLVSGGVLTVLGIISKKKSKNALK